jgi:ribosomal protein L24
MSACRIYVDGMKRKKVDGSEISVSIHPSNVMITKLTLEDKMRQAVFERAVKPVSEAKRPKEAKPAKEKAEKKAAQEPAKKPRLARKKKEGE